MTKTEMIKKLEEVRDAVHSRAAIEISDVLDELNKEKQMGYNTPEELVKKIEAEDARMYEKNRGEIPNAKETVSKALQEALGELAEIQRLINDDRGTVDFSTLEEIANLADNAAEECARISDAVNKAFA